MAEIDEIKEDIKAILESLNIAVVYDYTPQVSSWDKVLQKAVKNNSLNLIMFSYSTRKPVSSEDQYEAQVTRGWQLTYLMSVNEKKNSESTFDRNIEMICEALNSHSDIESRIEISSAPEMTKPKAYGTICNVLCHKAELNFETLNY